MLYIYICTKCSSNCTTIGPTLPISSPGTQMATAFALRSLPALEPGGVGRFITGLGNIQKSYGQSLFLMGKSPMTYFYPCSIAMCMFTRGYLFFFGFPKHLLLEYETCGCRHPNWFHGHISSWTWDAKAVANLIGNFLNMLLGHPGDLRGSYRLVVNKPCE